MIGRRGFILGAAAVLAAPAIVRADSLMKLAVIRRKTSPVAKYIPDGFFFGTALESVSSGAPVRVALFSGEWAQGGIVVMAAGLDVMAGQQVALLSDGRVG